MSKMGKKQQDGRGRKKNEELHVLKFKEKDVTVENVRQRAGKQHFVTVYKRNYAMWLTRRKSIDLIAY